MGRLLTIFFLSFMSLSVGADDLSELAKKSNLSSDELISFVSSGMSEYESDATIKQCIKKMEIDKVKSIYALFNYILFLDIQNNEGVESGSGALRETRKKMLIARFAKKSAFYCNS